VPGVQKHPSKERTERIMKYPEHEKLKDSKDHSQAIGSFVDWLLEERKVSLTRHHDDRYVCQSCGNIGEEGFVWDGGNRQCNVCEVSVTYLPAGFYDWNFGRIEDLLADYFEIDLKKLEDEKLSMISELRVEKCDCFSFDTGYMGSAASWCYWVSDYPDEGSVGPFDSNQEAISHAMEDHSCDR
jgi:hypothetical protein